MAHLHAKGDNLGGVLRNGGLSCLIRSIEILDPKALMLWCVELQKPSEQLIQMSSPRWSTNFLPKWTRSSDKRENESHQTLKLQRVLLHANVPSAPPKLSPSKYLQPPTHTPPHRSCSLMKSIGVSSKYEVQVPPGAFHTCIFMYDHSHIFGKFSYFTHTFFCNLRLGKPKPNMSKVASTLVKPSSSRNCFWAKLPRNTCSKNSCFFTNKVV